MHRALRVSRSGPADMSDRPIWRLDEQGIVRKIHTGYSPTLREDLIRDIDALLAD